MKEAQSMAAANLARQSEMDDFVFRLSTKHREDLLQLQEDQAAKLREARKSVGYGSDLIQGLHRSYGQQLETLILEITDLKRVNAVLQDRAVDDGVMSSARPDARLESQHTARPINSRNSSFATRDLQVKIQFIDFQTTYDVPSIEIPNPGTSFELLTKNVHCAISNYLAFLRSKDSIHSSSTDSALLYRLSLSLEKYTKLLFFGRGDPNGEEITKDKWADRGATTFDLIACVTAPHSTSIETNLPNVHSPLLSSRVTDKTALYHSNPPPSARSVDTATIWGKAPSVASRGRGYSIPRSSVISEVRSDVSMSPVDNRPALSSIREAREDAFDASSELRRINKELNELAGSQVTHYEEDDLSSEDEADMSRTADAYQDEPSFTLEGFARYREPLLHAQDDAEDADYTQHIDNTEDDEDGEGVDLDNFVSNAGSQSPKRARDSQDISENMLNRDHRYEMVGEGVDAHIRQEEVITEGVDLNQRRQSRDPNITEKLQSLPLYVDEFLMRPPREASPGKDRYSDFP